MAEPNARTWRRIAFRTAATVVASGVVTVVLLFASRTTAHAPADMGNLELGLPLAWATQDQSSLDPPSFPHEAFFVSPWEHPTTVDLPILLVDLLIVSAILWLLVLAWGGFSARRRGLAQGSPG